MTTRAITFNSETSLLAFIRQLPKCAPFHVEEVHGQPGRYVLYLD